MTTASLTFGALSTQKGENTLFLFMSITPFQELITSSLTVRCCRLPIHCDYKSRVISNYAPVLLSVALPGFPHAERCWHFNSTLLSNNSFSKFMEEETPFFFQVNAPLETSSLVVWDVFKAYIRGQIIYTANIKRQNQNEWQLLID